MVEYKIQMPCIVPIDFVRRPVCFLCWERGCLWRVLDAITSKCFLYFQNIGKSTALKEQRTSSFQHKTYAMLRFFNHCYDIKMYCNIFICVENSFYFNFFPSFVAFSSSPLISRTRPSQPARNSITTQKSQKQMGKKRTTKGKKYP